MTAPVAGSGSACAPARLRPAWRLYCLLAAGLVAAGGCSTVGEREPPTAIDPGAAQTADAVPRAEPPSRYGNPQSYEVFGRRYYTLKSADGFLERGIASWYGGEFHGRRTSSGERYDMYRMTAAHKTLPLPSYVEVTNLHNGRRATVRVNDRGPFHDNRVIDLSYAAAKKLGIVDAGTALVEVRAVTPGAPPARARPALRVADSGPGVPGFFLQVGAFRDRGNAERMRERLRPLIEALVDISTVDLGGAPMHRVRIGPLLSVDVADRVVRELYRIGVEHHTVTLN